ncbi:DUF3320 domain-containing protein [Myxococcota bacterium]|nr:DUF3320 domain-containing protein [Myxococcota bacterium]
MALSEAELRKRAALTAREAATLEGDSGVNVLNLAVGALAWREAEGAPWREAPVLLMPARLWRSRGGGYRLGLGDDEPSFNATLLHKLRQDFDLDLRRIAALTQEDEDGVPDVALILNSLQAAVTTRGWRVERRAWVTIYAFQKHLLFWELTQGRQRLLASPLVQRLLSPSPEPVPLLTPTPRRLRCPLDADASQRAALQAAAEGQTFVLEGPPGTGKSQTIANLIAHTLSEGKTVLFVSEKVAALEVVHARLEALGLGPACLSLHASEAQKQAVMASLRRALEAPRRAGVEAAWRENHAALEVAAAHLDAVAARLSGPEPAGPSLHEIIGHLDALGPGPRAPLSVDPQTLDPSGLAARARCVADLVAALRLVGPIADHPLREIEVSVMRPGEEARLPKALDGLIEAAHAYEAALTEVEALLKLPRKRAYADLERLSQLIGLLAQEGSAAPSGLITHPSWTILEAAARRWIERGRRRDALRLEVKRRISTDIVRLDVRGILRRYERWSGAFSLLSWLMLLRISRLLRPLWRGAPPPKREIPQILRPALELQDLEVEVYGLSDEAAPVLGDWWRGGEVNWDLLSRGLGWIGALRPHLYALFDGDRAGLGVASRAIGALVGEGALRSPAHPKGACLHAALEARARFDGARSALHATLKLNEGFWGAALPIEAAIHHATRWRAGLGGARDWLAWRRAVAAAEGLGLAPLVRMINEGLEAVEGAFWRGLYAGWVEARLAAPPLKGFHGPSHDQRIADFCALDVQQQRLDGLQLLADLSARRPAPRPAAARSQLGLLQAEAAKRRRLMPLRRLFKEAKEALRHLKPCLLMSPLSISRFLDLDEAPFDLVIFDEASQISPWDALGALARGRAAVIVGDPRQLPPTRFFDRGPTADDEVEADGESVLDACLEAGLPRLRLRGHYRSRHEQLIAFSDAHYYDEQLIISPTATPRVGGLSLRRVAGTYDRSRSRTNPVEAHAVVEEVRRRVEARPDQTLGVVTFNLAQQRLIAELLDEARLTHPALDAALEARPALFVKNLETVQGDERDVILFSLTFGPDARGQVHLNFGPLSQRGGERRLNVAITRAREALVVFSSLAPQDIDLDRVTAVGARDLRAFLELAGGAAMAPHEAATPPVSPLIEQVRRFLVSQGASVQARVGVGGWRVDLGVLDEAGGYRLGVLLDGPSYRAEATSDRDRLRAEALKRQGWRLHRLWAVDWWLAPEATRARLLAALKAAEAGEAVPPTPMLQTPTPRLSLEKGPKAGLRGASRYQEITLEVQEGGFYQRQRLAALVAQLEAIVEVEGPVSEARVARLLAHAYGLKTLTQRLKGRMDALYERLDVALRPRAGFLWPHGCDPKTWRGFRAPRRASARRDVEHIPVEEWANAAEAILNQQFGLPHEDLVRELAQFFGYTRLGERLGAYASAGISRLLEEKRAWMDGAQVKPRSGPPS